MGGRAKSAARPRSRLSPVGAKKTGQQLGGETTKYREAFHVPWARDLGWAGLTKEQIAARFGVSEVTLYNWFKKYPKLVKAVEEFEASTGAITRAVYNSALGAKTFERRTQVTPKGEVYETTVEKEHPPNGNVGLAILYNRSPHLWKAKTEASVDVNVTFRRAILELTDD